MEDFATAPQPHPGPAEATIRQNPPAYAKPLCTVANVPKFLSDLRGRIQNEPQPKVAQILMEELQPHITQRKGFTFSRPFYNTAEVEAQEATFRGMASGSGETAFDLPGLKLKDFIGSMFHDIVSLGNGIDLNERDLFHAHIVPNEPNP